MFLKKFTIFHERYSSLNYFHVFFYISWLSSRIVNGPSLDRSTLISAPNTPLSVTVFFSLQAVRIYSYNLFACSGFAASVKDGLFPLEQSAYKVNCETIYNSPTTSFNPKFILPSLSVNTLKLQSFITK